MNGRWPVSGELWKVEMQRFTHSSGIAATAPVTSEAEVAPGLTEAGQQLDHARSADREWRGALALRMHGRLAKLRKSDQLLQKCGVGLSGLMLVSAFAVPLWARGPQAGMNLFMQLILGALLSSAGSLGLIAGIGWAEDALRNSLARMGLTEGEASSTEEIGRFRGRWFCTGCRTRNEASARACSGCARTRPAQESLLLERVSECESAARNVVGVIIRVLSVLMGLGLLIMALRALALLVSGP